MKKEIMLVEDDPVSYECVRKVLDANNYIVHWFKTIAESTNALCSLKKIDLIILDRVLPDGDGLRLFSEIKLQRNEFIPVVILSSKSEEVDQVSGFYAGALDYIAKPFRPLEFKVRIESRLKESSKELHIGDVCLNLASFRAYHLGIDRQKELRLTHTEMKILASLMQYVNVVLSREFLLDKIWGSNFNITDRTIDAHISHLRKKLLGTNLRIVGVNKEGYRLEIATDKIQVA